MSLNGAVRLGSAVCVAGLTLLGPQALGVAVADNTATGAESTEDAGAGRPAVAKRTGIGRGAGGDGPSSRSGRVQAPASAVEIGEVRRGRMPVAEVDGASDGAAEADVVADGVDLPHASAAAVPAGPVEFSERVNETPAQSAGSDPVGPVPGAKPGVSAAIAGSAAAVADPAAPEVPVGPVRPAAGAAIAIPAERTTAIPAGLTTAVPAAATGESAQPSLLESAFAPVLVGIERLLDAAGQWLASFPPNPITDFLSGAVWLVRRTLFPVGDGVGLWGSADCVSTGDCSGQDLRGADLRGQDLTGVRFTNANLDRAILGAANLTRADLSGATLVKTDLAGADLTGANLTGANLKDKDLLFTTLAGANLTNANLTGARLWGQTATDLATATLVGANFTGQVFSSGNGTTLNWAGKDLTGVNLTGANLTGADLSRANLTGAQLAGVNLTRANLTDAALPGPGFLSPLVTATLTGANLTNVDLSGADLSVMNLTGTVLAGANLARTKLKSVNLTGANLVNAALTGADLTGADLTMADLLGANMLNTTLTAVVWSDTRCSYGNKTSAGCSNAALLSEPPADWLQKASTNGWQWYQYDGSGLDPDVDRVSTPTVRGSQGAPLQNVDFRDSKYDYNYDGIQGVVYNDTGQRIVVRTEFSTYASAGLSDYYCCAAAVLDPGDSVSYQLGGEWFYDDDDEGEQGILQFLRYDNGQTVGDPAQLWLSDGSFFQPSTEFYPPGYEDPVNRRKDWAEEEQHSEIWGGINISVKREIDGWRLNGSDTFNKYYPNPNDDATNDWAIFTIRVKSL